MTPHTATGMDYVEALIARGYDVDEPKSTPGVLKTFAAEQGVSVRTLQRALNDWRRRQRPAAVTAPPPLPQPVSDWPLANYLVYGRLRAYGGTGERASLHHATHALNERANAKSWREGVRSREDVDRVRPGGWMWSWSARQLRDCNWPGVEPWASDWGSQRHLGAAAARCAAWKAAGSPFSMVALAPYAWPGALIYRRNACAAPTPAVEAWQWRDAGSWPGSDTASAWLPLVPTAERPPPKGEAAVADAEPAPPATVSRPKVKQTDSLMTGRRTKRNGPAGWFFILTANGKWKKLPRPLAPFGQFMTGAPSHRLVQLPTNVNRAAWSYGQRGGQYAFEAQQRRDKVQWAAYDLAVGREK